MTVRVLVFMLLLFLGSASRAQYRTIAFPESSRLRMKALGSGGRLLVSERRFGFDSSHVQAIELDPLWAATPLSERRFPDYLWFMFDAAPAPGGMVVTGTLTSSYQPQLHLVNDDGSLAWARYFTGMTNSQTRIAMLFAEGADHYGYTNSDGFFGNGIYRVEGEETGTTFVVRYTTVAGLTYRMYTGSPAEVPENHVLGGSGIVTGSGEYDALIGHFSTNGCTWMKSMELNGSGGLEEVAGVVRMSGGGYAIAMNASGTPSSGFLLRVDDSGAMLDCVRIDDPAGVYIGDVTQLYDGTFLLAGSTASGTGMLYRITGTGSLVWARSCATCVYNTISSFHLDPSNDLFGLSTSSVFEISPDGDACGFSNVSGVSVTPFTPVFTDHTPTNDLTPAVTVSSMNLFERPPVGSSAIVCGASGMADRAGGSPLTAHPVPTTDVVRLGSQGQLAWNEPVEIRDLTGALLRRTFYRDGLEIGRLAPGTYLVTVPRTGQRAIVLRR